MNFFIGQRVRVTFAKFAAAHRFVGKETVITGPLDLRQNIDGSTWLGYSVDLSPRFAPAPEQLEPIIPDGAQPSEFTTLHDLLTSLEGVCV
jgi:hypothetical protein